MKAEFGDILYYIIFAVVILAGLLEKVAKSKRQKQQSQTPQPHDDLENVEEQPTQRQTSPQSLEEMMKRMLESIETPEQDEVAYYSEAAKPLEAAPAEARFGRFSHHQEEARIRDQSQIKATIEEEKITSEFNEFVFDARQAVIASEILNRKY